MKTYQEHDTALCYRDHDAKMISELLMSVQMISRPGRNCEQIYDCHRDHIMRGTIHTHRPMIE